MAGFVLLIGSEKCRFTCKNEAFYRESNMSRFRNAVFRAVDQFIDRTENDVFVWLKTLCLQGFPNSEP